VRHIIVSGLVIY